MRIKARQTLSSPPRFSTFLTNKPRLCAAAFLLSATFFTSPAGAFPTSTDLYKITEISAETYNTAQANQATDVFAFSSMDESGKAVTKYYQWLLSDDMFMPVPTAEDAVLSLQTTNADGSVTETHYKPAAGFTKGYTTEEGGELQDQRGYFFHQLSGSSPDLDIKGNFIGYDYSNEKSAAQGGGLEIYQNLTGGRNTDIHADFINNSVRGQASDYPYERDRLSGGGGAAFKAAASQININGLEGDFIGNSVQADYAWGGGLFILSENNGTNDSTITVNNIDGNFISNHIQGDLEAVGGAVANYATDGEQHNEIYIKKLNANFINNYAYSANGNSYGGAFANNSSYASLASIESATGNFVNNHAAGKGDTYGGAVYNSSYMENINGIFSNNYAYSAEGDAFGGAIFNGRYIENINGIFSNNYAYSVEGNAFGGAAYIYSGADIGNPLLHLNVKYSDQEMEIYMPMGSLDGNMQMVTGTITVGSEEEFSAYKEYSLCTHLLEVDPANFGAEDYVDLMIQSGAFQEEQRDEILAEFNALPPDQQEEELSEIRLMAEAIQNMVNNATPLSSSFGKVNFYNSSFRNNYVKSENGEAKGGAIYGNGINITADNYTSIIDGNKANDENNAFYVLKSEELLSYIVKALQDGLQDILPGGNLSLDAEINIPDLTFNTLNNGVILLNDGIDGESGYSVAMTGDKGVDTAGSTGGLSLFNNDGDGRTSQYIKLNNSIANAGNIDIVNTTLSFGKGPYGKGEITADGDPITKVSLQNAAFDLYNNYHDEVNLAGWSATDSYLHVDVDVDNLTADVLNINGNVEGTTKLVLYPTSAKDITGESIVFAQSSNDTTGTEDSFTVYRVYRSPYMFKVDMTGGGTTEHEWYLTMTDEKNEFAGVEPGEQPDPEVPDIDIPDIDIPDIDIPTAPVYGEVVVYGALPAAALEQTRNMVDNVGGQVAATRMQDAAANYNLWVNPTYYTSNIDSPFAIDADIWGIEAGGDIQRDIHNRLGVFFSYRQGEYDMNGNGDKYRSPVSSEIDIDSYIAGLYYRYDHNNWYAFATLYGGIQEADIKTDDGMKSDTDGVEFGASIEAGYDYALTDSVTLTPELGVFYTQVNYDDASDNVGKSASYDDARQIELEAGVKLSKTFMLDEGFASVYVKPSVVQTIVDGEDVNITGLGDVEALDDATLGRIEIGGRYGFTTNLSAYGWANYTFGSDYDATTFGLGLNYAF